MVCIKDYYAVYTHATGAARLSGLATVVCFAFEFGVLLGFTKRNRFSIVFRCAIQPQLL